MGIAIGATLLFAVLFTLVVLVWRSMMHTWIQRDERARGRHVVDRRRGGGPADAGNDGPGTGKGEGGPRVIRRPGSGPGSEPGSE